MLGIVYLDQLSGACYTHISYHISLGVFVQFKIFHIAACSSLIKFAFKKYLKLKYKVGLICVKIFELLRSDDLFKFLKLIFVERK